MGLLLLQHYVRTCVCARVYTCAIQQIGKEPKREIESCSQLSRLVGVCHSARARCKEFCSTTFGAISLPRSSQSCGARLIHAAVQLRETTIIKLLQEVGLETSRQGVLCFLKHYHRTGSITRAPRSGSCVASMCGVRNRCVLFAYYVGTAFSNIHGIPSTCHSVVVFALYVTNSTTVQCF